jgi:aminotransferase/cystathionine beta-lyase
MHYDFESIIDRSDIGSAKWQQMKDWKPDVSKGIVPFSVADMELKNPPEIIDGLKDYLDKAVLGYTIPTDGYNKAVCSWMKKRHDWRIQSEWIVGSEGVVGAFNHAIRALSNPGDGVIIQTPAYYPFYAAIERNNRKLVKNPLNCTGNDYAIDFEDLERKASDPNNKLLLFCSPHNPTGRVWKKEELERVGNICLKNNIKIISDEIHFDLIMPGNRQTVFATISDQLANNIITCTAPSKTFNLAGMQTSNIIISNSELRAKFVKEIETCGFFSMSILGYKACEIAYTKCEAWLDELIKLVYHNHLELKKYIEENIPQIKVFDLQGTYLQWMDFRRLNLDKESLETFLHQKAELFFDEGYVFGDEGIGFERMNLACPTQVMMDGLKRLKKALDSKGNE